MTLTFDLLTQKPIGVFLSLSSICVWSMKSLGQTFFELSRYNEVWTDRRTDGRTDRRTDKVITIGLPHLRWRGPNYCKPSLICKRLISRYRSVRNYTTAQIITSYRSYEIKTTRTKYSVRYLILLGHDPCKQGYLQLSSRHFHDINILYSKHC